MLSGENPAWFHGPLPPGPYTCIVRDLRQRMELTSGDFLYATLTQKGLERTVVGQGEARKQKSNRGDWLLAVMQNQLRADALQMLVTVEKEPRPGEMAVLKQIKPKFTWFEVRPRGIDRRISLHWQELGRYPA